MSAKIYLSNLKKENELEFECLKGVISKNQIMEIFEKHGFENKEKTDVLLKIQVVERKEASKSGVTHYISLDQRIKDEAGE